MNSTKDSLDAASDSEIDLIELLRAMWKHKLTIASLMSIAAAIGIVIALLLPNVYRAEVLLAPADQDGAGGLSGLAAQYGGLAALAGINLGSGSTGNKELALKIATSRKFVSEFITRRDILVPLMATGSWNSETGEIDVDRSLYNPEKSIWVRAAKGGKPSRPTLQEAHEEFLKILSVSEDRNSSFVRISIEHLSPQIARQWLEWFVADLNATLMKQDVKEAEQAIEYLNKEIENTAQTELQRVFYNLIEEQTKVVMLARVSPEYVFRTVDPAVAPEDRSKPNRVLIVLVAVAIGLLIGLIWVFVATGRQLRER